MSSKRLSDCKAEVRRRWQQVTGKPMDKETEVACLTRAATDLLLGKDFSIEKEGSWWVIRYGAEFRPPVPEAPIPPPPVRIEPESVAEEKPDFPPAPPDEAALAAPEPELVPETADDRHPKDRRFRALAPDKSRGLIDDIAARTAEVYALRRAGKSYRTIAAEVGIAPSTALRYVQQQREEYRQKASELCDAHTQEQLEQLEDLVQELTPMTRQETNWDPETRLQAIDRLLKVQKRIADLLGLDAATKIDVSGRVTLSDEEIVNRADVGKFSVIEMLAASMTALPAPPA